MTPDNDVQMISGKPLQTGPSTRLLDSQRELLVRLGLEEAPSHSLPRPLHLVLGVQAFLFVGALAMFLALHQETKLLNISLSDAMLMFFTGQKIEDDDKETLVTVHIVTTVIGHVLLLPQLYLLVVMAREKRTVFLQLFLATIGLLLTLATQAFLISLKRKRDGGCEEHGTCLHGTWAWFLTVNIFISLSIILVRVLFHLRLKEWLVSLKCVGPLIEFSVSRKCREFQALLLLICLGGTTLSGMVVNTGQVVGRKGDLRWSEDGLRVVMDTASYLSVTTGLLGLVLVYLLNHFMYSHTVTVEKRRLEEELLKLGTEHREVLLADRLPSKLRYCPVTRSCRPVESGQTLGGEVVEVEG